MDKTILGALALVFAVEAAEACTGMFAGREATADGSILIGRTVDFSPFNATMRQQVCERGASPCDNRHNRAPYVDRFLEANAIRCVIDLADAPDRIVAYRALESLDAPFWKALVDRGAVHPHPIKANFMTADYRAGIADALSAKLSGNPS